ncbi:Streptogrisin-B precursor [Corynebacterium atrinae]|uniref:trypsin-like serine protease n=1 Tax=Corynebacterium atrinae TaxID=1336740 RepID=UPI0025B373FE|nr:trypsin-like serine protease [Corynebacterium atrinae]WJY63876.1 Streptogrisin-B precursor [Corynebacterium atrinae]
MRTGIWATTAIMIAAGVAGIAGYAITEQAAHPTVLSEAAPAPEQFVPSASVRVPTDSPWAPGTAVSITSTLPVPGQEIRVGQCTIAYSFTAGEKAYAVTASHCGQVGNHVWASTSDMQANFDTPVGTFIYSDLYDPAGERLDAGIIEITNRWIPMRAPDNAAGTAVAQEIGALPPVVCKYGNTTGETCGAPEASEAWAILTGHDGSELEAFASTAQVCAQPGDSGGPVYADLEGQRVIIGLVSGTRGAADATGCDLGLEAMTMSYTAMPQIQQLVDRVVPGGDYL